MHSFRKGCKRDASGIAKIAGTVVEKLIGQSQEHLANAASKAKQQESRGLGFESVCLC